MIVDPGAVFVGNVIGGATGGSNTLELASGTTAGTLSGLGTKYQNFGAVTVDSGATWVLTGSNTIAGGVTFSDSGTLTNTGTLTGSGTFVIDPSTFTNSGSVGIVVTLSGAGDYLDNTGTGIIDVAGIAVYGHGAAATVSNAGTIEGTGTAGVGVYLKNGGSVANTGTAALIASVNYGVKAELGATTTVSNAGTIETARALRRPLQYAGTYLG